MAHRSLLRACRYRPIRTTLAALALVAGCAGTIERPALTDPQARSDMDSLLLSVEQISRGFTNLGRLGAVRERTRQLGLADRTRSEWIDWFSLQQNVMVELPGTSAKTIYVVAHYDKVDINPLSVASVLLNGLLDPLIAPLYFSSGAVDNATGVAVTLELAAALARQPHEHTYRFLLVGSEESGLRGSRAHVAKLSAQEKEAIELAVVIDTTGLRAAPNCVMDVSDPDYTNRALKAAKSLEMPLGLGALPSGASSDFEPFARTSFGLDVLRGFKFNLLGGLLPQRSWFTGPHEAPVLFFSVCELLDPADYVGSTLMVPIGRLHGPRDRTSQVDAGKLLEQYRIALRMLLDLEQADSASGRGS
jgi:hypothetical protein